MVNYYTRFSLCQQDNIGINSIYPEYLQFLIYFYIIWYFASNK